MRIIAEKYNMMINRICSFFESFLIQVFCFVSYKIVVDMVYLFYIGKTSGYGIEISILNITSSYLCVFLFSYFIYIYGKENTASSLLLIIINMIYFIPITTYCSIGLGSSSFLFFAIVFWGLLSLLQIKIPIITIKNIKGIYSKKFFYVLFSLVALFTVYVSVKYTGFRIIANIFDVYEIRAEAASYGMPILLSYLQNFSTILIPLLVLMAFKQKNYFFALFGCFLLYLNFSFAGHKSTFFMGILFVAGYLLWRNKMVFIIVPSGLFIGLLGFLEERIFRHIYIISFYFRRMGYVLAELSERYYQYFKNNPTDLFRSTFLGKLGFFSPYPLDYSKVIGNNYYTQTVSCNNGLLADVWAHLGIIGIIVMPVIIVVCFRLLDLASNGLDMRYLVGLGVYYAVSFSNSTWSTVLLTHGFLIVCLFFLLFLGEDGTE